MLRSVFAVRGISAGRVRGVRVASSALLEYELLLRSRGVSEEEIRRDLAQLADLLVEIVLRLGKTLDALIKGSKETLKLADSVERKEEEIDEFRHDLIAKILRWGDSSGKLSNILMIKEVIENIEAASDKAEDVADLIRSIIATGAV